MSKYRHLVKTEPGLRSDFIYLNGIRYKVRYNQIDDAEEQIDLPR